jgi:CheY-like chemotaxis protein
VDEIPGTRKAGAYVEITIRDEGVGIPRHNLERVFDPYFSTKEGGSGLGLTTAYSIVRRHGGLLTVESELGKGSSFRLYLPESEAPQEADDDATPLPRGLHGRRILVMDDNEAVREVVVAMLENLGCAVTGASDGEEALRAYTWARSVDQPFDAVILDLTVPGGMSGEETMQRLLRLDPEVRAIVASGYTNAPVMAEYRKHGFQAALHKPFRAKDVEKVLRRVVETPPSRAIGST